MPVPRRAAICLAGLGLFAALTGCGFQMRGSRSVSFDPGRVYVSEGGAAQLARELRRVFYYTGSASAGSVAAADVVVSVDNERTDRRVLSVDPTTGKVREFEMGYEAELTVRKADGTPLVENERLVFERDYVFDETAVLGKFEEERILLNELRSDAAETILHRLETLDID